MPNLTLPKLGTEPTEPFVPNENLDLDQTLDEKEVALETELTASCSPATTTSLEPWQNFQTPNDNVSLDAGLTSVSSAQKAETTTPAGSDFENLEGNREQNLVPVAYLEPPKDNTPLPNIDGQTNDYDSTSAPNSLNDQRLHQTLPEASDNENKTSTLKTEFSEFLPISPSPIKETSNSMETFTEGAAHHNSSNSALPPKRLRTVHRCWSCNKTFSTSERLSNHTKNCTASTSSPSVKRQEVVSGDDEKSFSDEEIFTGPDSDTSITTCTSDDEEEDEDNPDSADEEEEETLCKKNPSRKLSRRVSQTGLGKISRQF